MTRLVAFACIVFTASTLGGRAGSPDNFSRGRLVAWCIVPFDAAGRSPVERARMLEDLGVVRCAYDWRAEHVPTFAAEIAAYEKHGIEFTAFWGEHDEAFALFKKHGLAPQIWKTCPSPKEGDQVEKVAAAAGALLPLARRCKDLGSPLGLYNHGGWGGEPANLVAVCRALKEASGCEVGVVYNFHHAHHRIEYFEDDMKLLLPHLLCLNLNGMNAGAKPKILPLGEGDHEEQMVRTVVRSGYSGPVGIIDHRPETDSELTLRKNIAWLEGLRLFRE